MKNVRLPFVYLRKFFESTPDFSHLKDLSPVKPEPKATLPGAETVAPPKKKFKRGVIPDLRPKATPAPELVAPPPVSSRRPFTHHETTEPTLAQRTRPDLPMGDIRQQQHVNRYEDPTAIANRVRSTNRSSNPGFTSEMSNGHGVYLKPLTKMNWYEEPEKIGSRNTHLYDFLSSVGAHHMGTPNFVGTFHPQDKIAKRGHLYPDDNDSPEKRLNMARTHAGTPAHVSELSPGEDLRDTDPDMHDKVDDDHRLIGALAHTVFSNADGHAGNIRLTTAPSGKVHPVLIDNDLSGESTYQQHKRNEYGGETLRSEFLPGGVLAYNRNGKVVGTNYPPAVRKQLQSYANGEHFRQHGIDPEDAKLMQRNASDLLTHGLEGTLSRRIVNPRSKPGGQPLSTTIRRKKF